MSTGLSGDCGPASRATETEGESEHRYDQEHSQSSESADHWRNALARLTGFDSCVLAYMSNCTSLNDIDYGGFLQHADKVEKESCTLKRCQSIWHLGSSNSPSRPTAVCDDELKYCCGSGPERSMSRQSACSVCTCNANEVWMKARSRLWQRRIHTGASVPWMITGEQRRSLGYKVPRKCRYTKWMCDELLPPLEPNIKTGLCTSLWGVIEAEFQPRNRGCPTGVAKETKKTGPAEQTGDRKTRLVC